MGEAATARTEGLARQRHEGSELVQARLAAPAPEVGGFYYLVPILGSLLMLVLTVTGIYDWLFTRRARKAAEK